MKTNEKIYEDVKHILDTGMAFVQDQGPDFVEQLIRYEIILSLCGLLLSLPFLFGLLWVAQYYFKKHKDTDDADYFAAFGFAMISMSLPLLGIICNTVTLLRLTVAPKVYIFEYFSGLVK